MKLPKQPNADSIPKINANSRLTGTWKSYEDTNINCSPGTPQCCLHIQLVSLYVFPCLSNSELQAFESAKGK